MEESFSKEIGKCDERSAGLSSGGEDLISKLPDSLISQMLLYLPTKEAVRTSVLSHRWKSLWLLIPELELASYDFRGYNAFASFMDRLIGFCREEKSCLHKLKLSSDKDVNDPPCVTRWIDFVATPKLKHLDVECELMNRSCLEVMPLSLYICETLVYLRLHRVSVGSFESVSLPLLKTMHLEENVYGNESCLELLISSCPVLEDLSIVRRTDDNVEVLRVHSQTITSLSIEYHCYDSEFASENSGVLINAPSLKNLGFLDERSYSIIISNSGSLAKVSILGEFDLWSRGELQKQNMIRNFFTSILGVMDMKISSFAFQLLEEIMPSPQFCNLSCLEAGLYESYSLENLPMLLASCPNLRSLTLDICYCSQTEQIRLSFVPKCFLSSLEFVEIKSRLCRKPILMRLASYFAKKAVILKKLVLRPRDNYFVEDDLLALRRRSSSCQIVCVADL